MDGKYVAVINSVALPQATLHTVTNFKDFHSDPFHFYYFVMLEMKIFQRTTIISFKFSKQELIVNNVGVN